MTPLEMFCVNLLTYGKSFILNQKTGGDSCPCLEYRDGSYSREWHRLNPDELDCKGTGIIDGTPTETICKGTFSPLVLNVGSGLLNKQQLEQIGEIQESDLALFGTVRVSDGAFLNLSTLNKSSDYILYDGTKYIVKNVFNFSTSDQVGQLVVLSQKE